MCIHHIIYHGPCGHFVKNTPLCNISHCAEVERAIRYYHDQTNYHLSDCQLLSKYDIPTNATIRCPAACPEHWPPSEFADPEERAAYAAWATEWQDNQTQHWEHHGITRAQTIQNELDNTSENVRRYNAQQHNPNTTSHKPKPYKVEHAFTNAPYPANQLEHLVNLERAQRSPLCQPKWNTIIYYASHGCGANPHRACLHGHFLPNQPQCPYLLAARQPAGVITPEVQLLSSFSPGCRGGAVNVPHPGMQQESTRAALLYTPFLGGGVGMQMVPLGERYLEGVFKVGRSPLRGSWHEGVMGMPWGSEGKPEVELDEERA